MSSRNCLCVFSAPNRRRPEYTRRSWSPFKYWLAPLIQPLVRWTWFTVDYCTLNVLYAAFDSRVPSGAFTEAYRVEDPSTVLLYPRLLQVDPSFPAEVVRATNEALRPFLSKVA